MSVVLVLLAAAVVLAVTALALTSGQLSAELARLRRSLRRLEATAVAGDELSRALGRLSGRAAGLRSGASRRLSRFRRPSAAG